MNAKCRICRRKGDPEQMLLCDGCDRGHHMYCLKPKMKKIPTGDWYCNECKPKERVKTPKKKARQVFNEEDDEDGNDEDEDQQDEERAGSSSDEVLRFFTRFGLVYTLIQRGQFSLQPPSPTHFLP